MRRQQQILDYIKQHVVSKGYPPTTREIGAAVGLSSSGSVHGHLERMQKKGLIAYKPSMPRTIRVLVNE